MFTRFCKQLKVSTVLPPQAWDSISSTGIEHTFAEFSKSAILQPVPRDHGTIKCTEMSYIEMPYSPLAATSAFHVSVCMHAWMNMIHCSIVIDQFSGSTFACPFPLFGNQSGRAAFGAEPITFQVASVIGVPSSSSGLLPSLSLSISSVSEALLGCSLCSLRLEEQQVDSCV